MKQSSIRAEKQIFLTIPVNRTYKLKVGPLLILTTKLIPSIDIIQGASVSMEKSARGDSTR